MTQTKAQMTADLFIVLRSIIIKKQKNLRKSAL